MRETICTALPWVALILTLLGMRDWDPAIPASLVILIIICWAINWLVHHLPLRWLRYLRYLIWVIIVGAIIVVPELRTAFEEFLRSLLSLQSSTLIVLALAILIVWVVLCLARPAPQTHT